MITLAEPEAEALEEFRFSEGLGYALPRRHVLHRWTWEETQRYLNGREERRLKRMEVRKEEHVRDVLEAVRSGRRTAYDALVYLEKVWPEPTPIGMSLEEAFPESRERGGTSSSPPRAPHRIAVRVLFCAVPVPFSSTMPPAGSPIMLTILVCPCPYPDCWASGSQSDCSSCPNRKG